MAERPGKNQPSEPSQHWRDLCEALEREAEAIGGHGRVVVELVFHAGAPQEMHVRDRAPRYRLGSSLPPLTGRSPLARLQTTQ
jgi:hypothetical protein